MTTNTIFDLASCSKPIGAGISILILAERGKLRLTDPVNRYIPDFENWKLNKGNSETTIRIEDLLTHTSGLPPYAPTQTLIEKYGSPNPDGLMDYICHVKRDF
jgi:CubicO group peptidase (beta-lactamase class C family)